MKTRALAHGAATIVNAIATGKGAAFGISLETTASVEVNGSGEFSGTIAGSPGEDTRLMELCAKKVFERLKFSGGASIETESDIPIASGLKSSSTAANAVVLAAYWAARKEAKVKALTDKELLDIAIDAAFEAKVTVTGAFDDAAASYYGGYVVTDNAERKILKKGLMDDDLEVVIYVPEGKSYTANVDVKKTREISKEVTAAWKEALSGNLYGAMNMNGLLYSRALGYDSGPELTALAAGALGCGLSGKGPSVVAIVESGTREVEDSWKDLDGVIIRTKINNKKAEVLS